ncbi:GDNF family receptor alpha-1-like isoform X1 [Entelurus aequoreus]|uniref:GDNF family receptor alpha-1-like isoform X1 n=1 Tax=Entelurus aequoreus TaxID=161455 RepID=UPI002B1D3693|nr:GDNF family receptor alpha-1-like isoform X1 [Entelurus aequoreus]
MLAVRRQRTTTLMRTAVMMLLLAGLLLLDVPCAAEEGVRRAGGSRPDCVRASEQCLQEPACSSRYRTIRQCVSGKHGNFSQVGRMDAQDECRSAVDALRQSPLYRCRCKRSMKKEKNCLRVYWGIYHSLQGNDFLEDSPYEPGNSRLADIFRLAPILGEPALARENKCLNAAKACNLNDTCKKYRSAYISPCTSRVSTAEVCNKRKCHKALRHFFDKVPAKHSYGMLFCSCPAGDQTACSERRRQTIVPACSYEDKHTPNCLELQDHCRTNYICRSRLADFFANCQPEPRSLSGCLRENYADCLLAYSGLIGTVMTPNFVRSAKISVSPYCDCSKSGNNKDDCDKLTTFFTDNACLRNAIQAFGNGTDIGVQPPISPAQTTSAVTSPYQRNRQRNNIDNHINTDTGIYHFCGSLQAQKLKSNSTTDSIFCVDPQIDGPSVSNSLAGNSAASRRDGALLPALLPPVVWLWTH